MSGTLMGMQGMGSNGLGVGGPQQQIPPGLMQMLMQHQQQGGGMMQQAPQIGQGGPMAPQLPMGQGGPQGPGGMMPHPGMQGGPPPGMGPQMGMPGASQQPVGVGQAMGQNLPALLMALKGGQNGLSPQGGGQTLPGAQDPNAPGQSGYLQMLLQHLQGGGAPQMPASPGTGGGAGGMT